MAAHKDAVPVWHGPAPKPIDVSVAARRLIDLANVAPAGTWVSYGDLADAYAVRHDENMVARGVASALSLLPEETFLRERVSDDPQPWVDQWQVPWHRVRLATGQATSRRYGLVKSDDFVNRMLVQEGGMVRHGAATDSCRFGLLGRVRAERNEGHPDSQAASPKPEVTDEQKQRLAARAQERQHRLAHPR